MPEPRTVWYEGTYGVYKAELIEEGTGKVRISKYGSPSEVMIVPMLLVEGIFRNFRPPQAIGLQDSNGRISA